MRRAAAFLLLSALVSTAGAAEPMRCIVQPTHGSVLETSFLVGCTGGEEGVPLRVYLRDHATAGPYQGRLVHVLPGPGAYRVKLPMGDADQAYAMGLHVHGADSPPTNVTVTPPHHCEPLAQLVATPGGDVPVDSSVHPTLSMVAVAASYAAACGHSPDSTSALLLPLLQRARVRTPLQLEHGAEALRALGLAIAGLSSSGGQLGVTRLASHWAGALRSRSLLSASQEPRLASSVALLRAVATLHGNAVRDPSSCHHGPSRTVPRALLSTLDEVQRTLASSVQDSLSLHLSGYGVCVRGAQPRERVTTLGLPNGSVVNLEPASAARCLVMDVSPFPCADDSLLNTQFVMVKRADGHAADETSIMVELFLRKRRPDAPLAANNRAYASRGLVTLHKLDVPAAAAGFDLLVHLEPERPIDLLQVTFSAGREPTEAELLRSPGPEWRSNRTLVPRVALGGRPLFVAVRLKLEWGVGALRPADPRRVRYRLWTALVACRSWRRPAWSGRGCAAVLDSSLETLHCRCSHLSWFSGAHWVAPNEISWRKVSRGVRERHLLVSSCVLALWLLYGAVLLWARRADQRDEVYNTVTDLQQNLPTDQQPYIVTIITGFRRNAGTTSKVWLQLVGSEGSSRTFLLKDENVNPGTLQRKSEDYFLATTERALGEITEVVFTLEARGTRAPWFLHTVVVQDMLEDLVWVFFVEQWLQPEGGDQDSPKSFRFRPADGQQQADFWTLFRRRLQRHFFTGHTWFNVIARYRSSKFTRAQRVTCALFVILSAMMFNVMYHDVDTSSDGEHLSFFEVPVHLNDFLLGLQEYARLVREGRRGLLPWWFQLVGWVVALAGSLVCSAVICLYGFSYGDKRSKEWLFRSLTGLLHNEIILEPLKVILISACLARLIPRPPEVDDYSLRNTLTELPEDLRP
ncbi:polycystin-1-like protein 2 isoform X2 [Dermacentor variabilis]|uniref:polycystin-1-like protein 2 isoform X2 n=1 Tax=Dermacentor variabilis TaxID=34621 RepID=UPI003F5B24AA